MRNSEFDGVVVVYKPLARTPLETLNMLREVSPENYGNNIPLSYAGRLDPMARGVLLVLVGCGVKSQKQRENLEKDYRFDILFGIRSDTFDFLGMCSNPISLTESLDEFSEKLETAKNSLFPSNTKIEQSYPPYSSIRVRGKPLFWWSKNGRLSEVEIPRIMVELRKFEILEKKEIRSNEIVDYLIWNVRRVNGDFRQNEIIDRWRELLKIDSNGDFGLFFCASFQFSSLINFLDEAVLSRDDLSRYLCDREGDGFRWIAVRFEATVSSGFYIRSLANRLGDAMQCGAITIDILRTRVGEFTIDHALRL